ncbi:hypothetical protein Patl1_21641 [Pistacia atlantica]|uniref:Uncharacterized protein n=1 Tax=Pistacia atlantica TaxID=434234 RepID=A0ACC1BI64_9ROSI|nr:hypothetical protein Patl1_21641 [Pistacia atlantica]
MNKLMVVSPHADNNHTSNNVKIITGEVEEKPQTVFIHPTMESDQFLPAVTYNDYSSGPSSDQYMIVDEGLWGGLWNLEVPLQHGYQETSNCNKMAMQNQPGTAFTFGGEANYNLYYNEGGYIF